VTKTKNLGIRARAPIVAGTFLGIYSGEFIAEHVSEARGAVYEKVGRT
jgi:SET domain-containing protein